jgi:hypothetical protein
VYGSISKKEEQEVLEELRSRRPFLFEEEVQIGCLDRFFIWLQKVFA